MYLPNLELLTPDAERQLARRYVATHDPAIAERLVRAHLRLVITIAKHYRFSRHDVRDLFQAGCVGLLQALEKYDPERGVRLSSYAVSWIHAKILQFLWENRRLVRAGARQRALGRSATEKQREAQAALARHLRTSERGLDLLPLRASETERPDVLLEDLELRARVRERVAGVVGTLDKRRRAIFERRFLAEEPESLQAIGDRFGISRERARQLEADVLARLRRSVAGLGA
jgi:RNA polymerase sigma-32 factor